MIKIKCIQNYRDLKTNTLREAGKEYIETDERAKQIINKGFAVMIEEIEEEVIENAIIEQTKETAKKKTNAKK